MKSFHKRLLLSKVPLKGYFKYREEFQIYPADLINMPRFARQKHFPLILEYWTTPDEHIPVETETEGLKEEYAAMAIQSVKEEQVLYLLTTITNYHFFNYNIFDGFWGIPMLKDDPDDEANTWSSKWCMTWFHFPELARQMAITGFTDVSFPPVGRMHHVSYYRDYPNVDFDSDKEIVFPATIEKALDGYFQQNQQKKNVLYTVFSNISAAVEMRRKRSTMSLLAAFTALEALINEEYKEVKVKHCETCSQPRYSIASKFRNFLLHYIGGDEFNKKKFNSYYTLRSKITHTGLQLKNERLFTDVTKEQHEQDFLTQIEIIQMTRMATVNWLILNAK